MFSRVCDLLGLVGATPGGDMAPLLLRGHKSVSKRIVNKGALSFSSVCGLVLFVFFHYNFSAMKSSCENTVKKIEIMHFADVMISNISSVRIRYESVFDDTCTKFCQCHTEK